MTDLRPRILSCACDLYLSDGIEGFSMRKLARKLGVTAPALYRHFDGKDTVLVAVVEEAYRMFAEHIYRALRARTPVERLQRAGDEYIQFALNHPHMYEMLYVSPHMLGMESFPERLLEMACATGQFWQDRVRECMEVGFLKTGDPVQISTTMWSHAHGLVTIYLRGLLPVSREEFLRLFRESGFRIMQGLAGPEAERWLAEKAEAEAHRAAQAVM